MKVNHGAWVKLLEEDIEWLRQQPRTLERDHVIGCLEMLKLREHYDLIPEPWPPA